MSHSCSPDGAIPVRPSPRLATARYAAAAAAGAGAVLLLAACSSSASGSAPAQRQAAAPAAPAPQPGAAGYGASGTINGATSARQLSVSDLARLSPAQSIIYTATLTISVSNVTATATQASNDAAAAGGYIASEQQTQPRGKHKAAQVILELKIPVAAYQTTLTKLSALGKQLSFSTQAQDVTQQVADVTSRVTSAQAAIKQLRALLSRAGNVGQLLSVQDEINTQESSLESLLAQQRALSRETSYGTVTLQVNGPHAKAVHKKKPKAHHGLVAGLGTGWRALKVVVVWLLTALGTVLPFAVPIVVIGGIIYIGRRRLIRRRAPRATAPPAATS